MRGVVEADLEGQRRKERDLESASHLSHSLPISLHQSRGISSGGRSGSEQPANTKIKRINNPAVGVCGADRLQPNRYFISS